MPILTLEHISMSFGGLKALSRLSLEVDKGSISSLIGPNGAGKTTVFNIITGIYRQDRGRVIYRGKDISRLPGSRVTALGIARTFQNIRLFQSMTALENVMVGMHSKTRSGPLQALFKTPFQVREEKESARRAFEILEFLGLADLYDDPASSLPYGGQRRLEIARAMAADPGVLLLDEPAAGMNPLETRELMDLILKLRERGLTIVLVEHDMKLVMGISESITVLDHGAKIAQGTPDEIRTNEKVIEAYIGSPMKLQKRR